MAVQVCIDSSMRVCLTGASECWAKWLRCQGRVYCAEGYPVAGGYAGIVYVDGSPLYVVVEPPRPPEKLLEEVEELVAAEVSPREAARLVAERRGLGKCETLTLEYHVVRDFELYGALTIPLNDPFVEDVYAAPGRVLRVVHQGVPPHVTWIESNILVTERDVELVASKAGAVYSYTRPLAEGALGDIRVAVSSPWVSGGRPVLVARRHIARPSLRDLVDKGFMPGAVAEVLRLTLLAQGNVFIVGPTASGKTTLLNALLETLPRDWHIVTVEETPELRLRHPGWTPLYATGGATLFDLVKHALRMRPQVVVVGETRGEEARVLIQAFSLGHAGGTTFHATGVYELVSRLASHPISIGPSFLRVMHMVVVLGFVGGLRKLLELHELEPYSDTCDFTVAVRAGSVTDELCFRTVYVEGEEPRLDEVLARAPRLSERLARLGLRGHRGARRR